MKLTMTVCLHMFFHLPKIWGINIYVGYKQGIRGCKQKTPFKEPENQFFASIPFVKLQGKLCND